MWRFNQDRLITMRNGMQESPPIGRAVQNVASFIAKQLASNQLLIQNVAGLSSCNHLRFKGHEDTALKTNASPTNMKRC